MAKQNRILKSFLPVIAIMVVIGLTVYLFQVLVYIPAQNNRQIKQNTHAIQLAVERYAVDTDRGTYPKFLYGGDNIINIGSVNYYYPAGRMPPHYWGKNIHLPYDDLYVTGDGFDYSDRTWKTTMDIMARAGKDSSMQEIPLTGDILTRESYMPRYPSNPFAKSRKHSKRFGPQALGTDASEYSGYGGRDGTRMFNLGIWGECVQLMANADGTEQPRLDFPGGFFYHALWRDNVSNFGHLRHTQQNNPGSWLPGDIDPQLMPPLDDSADVESDEVRNYRLAGFGACRTKGQDLDVSLPGGDTPHMFRTGYLQDVRERNPWVEAGDYGDNSDFDSRPHADGIHDFIIISVEGGVQRCRCGERDLSSDCPNTDESPDSTDNPTATNNVEEDDTSNSTDNPPTS